MRASMIGCKQSEADTSDLPPPDPSPARAQFCIPPTADTAKIRAHGSECVYLCGNSLGLQPKGTRACIAEELDKWAEFGVEGHFRTVNVALTALR